MTSTTTTQIPDAADPTTETSQNPGYLPVQTSQHHTIVIIGGGTAGITTAAQLIRKLPDVDVAVIEPSEVHYYQPIWTLVGGGLVKKEDSARPEKKYMPEKATWIREAADAIDPEKNTVTTTAGTVVGYDFLVVAAGIQLDWHKVPGLKEAIGRHGVCSNYSYETVDYTWECLQAYKGQGNALFTTPNTPIKCGGAPQKIMYLAADYFRKNGVLHTDKVRFYTPGTVIFGVPEFARTLEKVIARYGISFNLGYFLAEISGERQEAIFESTDEETAGERITVPFELIHVTPPQSAPDFIKRSLLVDETGWVDVDKTTLQHQRYPNVFALGDVTNTPNAKTGAAVRKQAPVLVQHLLRQMTVGDTPKTKLYNGYSSCPLVTGHGKLVLAEFDYENRPDPSFPFDTTKERRSMWLLKKLALPWLYWNLMLRGKA